ncbi:RagB/SusD family nutrient uptake outer membrane protein [Empedobacter stercoris]|uniref:RagB/SusD family nutrient uptake outer membrane protein n=1 Tax=Empedobacter stercoris TaxID=1628248 RepID=UPI001CE02BE0|nr:RagB/SusD family nutrient uptake outer membrane protein [Empedobacter stercoris]MCA4777680.1 RagB/SusD family nutrient uptake outer membrane protein [Empedobacter stercoris]
MKKNILVLSLLACALSFTSCSDDDINQKPFDAIEVSDYYKTESDFTNALNGVYKGFGQAGYYAGLSNASDIIAVGDIMSDNLILDTNGRRSGQRAHTWAYNSNSVPTSIYSTSYNIISRANIILANADNLPDGDFKNNVVAQALLGKIYLYKGDYKKAIEFTQPAVDAVAPANPSELAALWTSNNSNGVLFEIPFVNSGDPTIGTNFSQGATDENIVIKYAVDKDFYALYNQETEPERVNAYFKVFTPSNHDYQQVIAVNKYINGKVKLGLNNGRYLRVEEAILNLAEAQYLAGDSASALTTLNKLRDVRYSSYEGGETGAAIFDAIQLERRKELAFENGDRWFTLKRLQGVSGISSAYTSGIQRSGNGYLADGTGTSSSELTLKAGDFKWQFPIPQSVLNLNTNMTQTPGY